MSKELTVNEDTTVSLANISQINGLKVKGVKAVTLPSMELALNVTKFLRFNTNAAEWIEKKIGKDKEPAIMANVTDMETMAQYTLIMPAVVKANLEDSFPDGNVKDRIFAITNKGKVEGKRYKAYEIFEIELEE